MADVKRYSAVLSGANATLVEIFQREVGKTQRYMYIPTSEINDSIAIEVCKIINNGGNISTRCDVESINGGNTYYFKWKVKESLKIAEAKVYDEVFDFIENATKLGTTTSTTNTTTTQAPKIKLNPFTFKVGDIFEFPSTGKKWKIIDIINDFDNYVVQEYVDGQLVNYPITTNRNAFESDVSSGALQLVTKSGANQNILDELKKVQKGDIIKTTRKKDGSIFKELEVIDYRNFNGWSIEAKVLDGMDKGSTVYLYSDYWEEVLKKGDLEIEIIKKGQQPIEQAKPTIYAFDLGGKQIVEVISLDSIYSELKKDIWNLKDPNEEYDTTRENFFVVGDIVKLTLIIDKTVWKNVKIIQIDDINDVIYFYDLDANDSGNIALYELFYNYNVEIKEYYNLRELFDQPVLVPKEEGNDATTPITPSSNVLQEIEQLKKDLGQLLFMRNLLSPIDFEQKIEVTQLIEAKQKLINELNFKGIEEKMATDQFFDDLFEQSFTPLQHEYQDIYTNNGEEIDFFTPNGQRTQLSFELNEIIRTPQFKEWFGDWELAYIYKDADALELDCSKVLTPNFEPRVVWHGTGREFSYFIFDKFPASYFAVNREYSQFFADLQGGGDGYVIPFFLNIRNPLDLTHFNTNLIGSKDFFDYMYLMTGLTMEQLDVNPLFLSGSTPPLETWMYLRNNPKMLKKIADTNIYDGIHFYETNPNITDTTSLAHKTEAYITFKADQCKIAEPNRGMLLFASLKSFLLEKGGKI